jgi:hypothetical protein
MQKLFIDSPTASIPRTHFAHSFHTIPNSAYKFTMKMEAACTSETLFHSCQTARRYVFEKSKSSLLCTDKTKDITAAITSLVYKLAVQCINCTRQDAGFMFGIAACTVKQVSTVDRIAWLQDTACVLLLQNTYSSYPALHPEGRKIRCEGLSRSV